MFPYYWKLLLKYGQNDTVDLEGKSFLKAAFQNAGIPTVDVSAVVSAKQFVQEAVNNPDFDEEELEKIKKQLWSLVFHWDIVREMVMYTTGTAEDAAQEDKEFINLPIYSVLILDSLQGFRENNPEMMDVLSRYIRRFDPS